MGSTRCAIDVEFKASLSCDLLYGFYQVGMYRLIRRRVVGIVIIEGQSRPVFSPGWILNLRPSYGAGV